MKYNPEHNKKNNALEGAGDVTEKIEKKEMPPILKMDMLIENCNKDNIRETITELQALIDQHRETGIKKDFREKMKWEQESAEEKRKNGDIKTKEQALYHLQALAEINRQIDQVLIN